MKTYSQTKVWVLIPNLASKISYERILNNFQIEAVHSGVFAKFVDFVIDTKSDKLFGP